MELERVARLIVALTNEYRETRVAELLEQLESSLQSTIGRNDTTITDQFIDTRVQIHKALASSMANRLRPSEIHLLEQLGGLHNVGNALARRLAAILDGNRVTPALAVQEISQLRSSVAAFFSAADSFLLGLRGLGFEDRQGPPAEDAELGVMLPRMLVANSLDGLQKELRQLDQHLRAFGELVDQSYGSPSIRSLATGGFEIFLNQPVVVAAAVMAAVERLAALYKQILEIRLLSVQLKEKGVSANATEALARDEEAMIARGVDSIVDGLMVKYQQQRPTGRDKELRTMLTNAVKYLGDRIDRGVNIEATPPSIQPGDAERDLSPEVDEVERSGAILASVTRDEAPVLRLLSGSESAEQGVDRTDASQEPPAS